MTLELLGPDTPEAVVTRWFAWYQAAFLFGAAAGGWLFGWLGDRVGRTRGAGGGVLCYSLFTLACYFADSADAMLVLRFLACLGVGGRVAERGRARGRGVAGRVAAAPRRAARRGRERRLRAARRHRLLLPDHRRRWRWTLLVGASPGGARAADPARSCRSRRGGWRAARRTADRPAALAAARGAAAAAAVADDPRHHARGDPGRRLGGERELAGAVDRPRGSSSEARGSGEQPKKPDRAEQGDDADHAVRRGGVRQPARRDRRQRRSAGG